MSVHPDSRATTGCVVLHIEDCDADAYLLRLALQETKVPATVYRVSNGEQALKFLRRSEPYQMASTPDLIFLDLNLPRVSGLQVLQAIREDEQLKSIPVVVMTTSAIDRGKVMNLGAHRYVCKPFEFEEFLAEVQIAYQIVCPVAGEQAETMQSAG